MNAVHSIKAVPAHRVVNSQGLLTGKHHFKPPSSMQKSLEKEGVKVLKDKVVDFEKRMANGTFGADAMTEPDLRAVPVHRPAYRFAPCGLAQLIDSERADKLI